MYIYIYIYVNPSLSLYIYIYMYMYMYIRVLPGLRNSGPKSRGPYGALRTPGTRRKDPRFAWSLCSYLSNHREIAPRGVRGYILKARLRSCFWSGYLSVARYNLRMPCERQESLAKYCGFSLRRRDGEPQHSAKTNKNMSKPIKRLAWPSAQGWHAQIEKCNHVLTCASALARRAGWWAAEQGSRGARSDALYICIYIYIYVYVIDDVWYVIYDIHVYIYIYIQHVWMYVYIYIHTCIHVYVCICIMYMHI